MPTTAVKTQSQTRPVAAQSAAGPVRSLNISYDEKLDHLRFLAALLIILFHSFPPLYSVMRQIPCDWHDIMKNLGDVSGAWLVPRAFIAEGHTAVGFFLTISGFLFARITANSDINAPKFYLNRLLRIYPLYLCFILLALFLTPGANPLQSICLSVLALQNLPQATYNSLLTPHLWSVAVEFQIYLLFPVILAEYRSKGLRTLFMFIAAAIGLKALVYLITGEVQTLAYNTVFGRIDQFLIGAIFGYTFAKYRHKIQHPLFCLLALTLTAAAITTFHTHGGILFTTRKSIWMFWPALESAVWGAFIVAYCASSFHLPKIIARPLSFLGGISYSLYVTHFAIYSIVVHRVCGPLFNLNRDVFIPIFGNGQQENFVVSVLAACLSVLPATILASCVTYFAIEKPFMNRRVKYTVPRPQLETAANT